MNTLHLIIIIFGIWGVIAIIGNIIRDVQKIKTNNNPLKDLFNNKNKEEK